MKKFKLPQIAYKQCYSSIPHLIITQELSTSSDGVFVAQALLSVYSGLLSFFFHEFLLHSWSLFEFSLRWTPPLFFYSRNLVCSGVPSIFSQIFQTFVIFIRIFDSLHTTPLLLQSKYCFSLKLKCLMSSHFVSIP